MTCGACDPKSFQSNKVGQVFGYAVATCPTSIAYQARDLHFLGAAHVFADHPTGRVMDRLILSHKNCLGTRPERHAKHLERFEAAGIEITAINPNFDEWPS
jgi:hypothetical protein